MTAPTRSSSSRNMTPGCPLTCDRRARDAQLLACLTVPAISFATRSRPSIGCGQRRRLAAAVAVDDDVGGEQLLERREVAVLGRGEEALGELVAMLPRGLEARPALVDVPSRADDELAAVVLALVDDRGDLVVAVVEHLAQQEHGALDGREALEQHEERHRERVGHLGVRRRIGSPASSVSSGSGSHGPTYCSRRTRAERSWSIASRVVTADRYAFGRLDPRRPPPRRGGAAGTPPGRRPRPR